MDYTVYRKTANAGTWGAGIVLDASLTDYVDEAVLPGVEYEYGVVKSTVLFPGYGFISTGIDVPLVEYRGKLVLIVDTSQAPVLAAELALLQQDLVGDGWLVLRHDVARDASVMQVKELIAADCASDPGKVTAVFLFGHVPVPYSGDFAPDGHADHGGAWPADVYYADIHGAWTDAIASNSTASDSRNWNTPGDGKFDQTTIPLLAELQVGRVDLAHMPSFPKPETELLRQYLNKDHAFRHKLISPQVRGLIHDEFGNYVEAFAADGWGNFSSLFGAPNATPADWFPTLTNESSLWAYGCGLGTNTSAGNIGVAQFATTASNAVFTALFGSYFGDWDTPDNLLRAPLANSGYGLVSVWAGRPFWYFHHMGQGHTIGYSTRITQNNLNLYPPNANARGVHAALMGDPTLRLHPIAPPSSLKAARGGTQGATLSWAASTDSLTGYNVYRASDPDGPFTKLNDSLVTRESFSDPAANNGAVYMVRGVRIEDTGAGTYWNASQGIFGDLDPPNVTLRASVPVTSAIGSNPAEIVFSRTASLISPLIVRYKLGGTAVGGIDYELLDGQLTIPAGSHTASVLITPKPTGDGIRSKSVQVILRSGSTYAKTDSDSATIFIKSGMRVFAPYKGSYSGLLQTQNPSEGLPGFITIRLDSAGGFTAVVRLDGKRIPLSGVLDETGSFTSSLRDQPGSAIQFTLNTADGTENIVGTVTADGGTASAFSAHRGHSDSSDSAARGRYTVALLPDASPPDAESPQGAGWGVVTINRHGRGRFIGALGDGKKVTLGMVASDTAKSSFFSTLYHAKGWIYGEVSFFNSPGANDVAGVAHWYRPPAKGARFFPSGFSADVSIMASRYVPPTTGRSFAYQHAAGNGCWKAQGGGLTTQIGKLITVDQSGVTPIESSASDTFTLKVARDSGLVEGSFFHPILGSAVKLSGVILQKQNRAIATFLGGTQTGLVTVERNPNLPGTEGGGINGDSVPPTIAIDTPTPLARMPEVASNGRFILPSVIVSGFAADDSGIAAIQYQLLHNGTVSSLQPASGTSNWSFSLYIKPQEAGEYTVLVKAIDANGNESVLTSRTFTYVVLRNLSVTVSGSGEVTAGFLGTSPREIGARYTVTATPAAGHKFGGWAGSIASTSNTISFAMAEGIHLQADFEPE